MTADVVALMLMATISGTGRESLPPAGPCTPPLARGNGMSGQITYTHPERRRKREQLKEIVFRLGPDATPPMIREEAYRVGFGNVNGLMLVHVRNELWPDRKREQAGRPVGIHDSVIVAKLPDDSIFSCQSCGSSLTVIRSVSRMADGSIKRKHICKDCGGSYLTQRKDNVFFSPKAGRRYQAEAATEKTCTGCKRLLPIESFGRKASFGPDSVFRRPKCYECCNKQRRHNYGTRSIQQMYGITQEQYASMLASQGGICLICGNPEVGKRAEREYPLAIDHDHTTGKVRGLLCQKCNLGIGNFNDDVTRLEAAVAYLRRHQAGRDERG